MTIKRTQLIALAIAVAFPLAATAQDKGPQDSTGMAPEVTTPPAGAHRSDQDKTKPNRGRPGTTGTDVERHGGTTPFGGVQSGQATDSAVLPQDPNVQSGTSGSMPSERSAKE
jgi:hypothetical protein